MEYHWLEQNRFFIFLGVFFVMGLLEVWLPMREQKGTRAARWSTNIVIAGLGVLAARLVLGSALLLTATFVSKQGWGFFHLLRLDPAVEIFATIAFFDFCIYLQHIMFHAMPALWRLHLVHHTDLTFDLTTAIRFHPIEIVISMVFKLGLIVITGASPLAVVMYEILLNGMALFNHSNVRFPKWIDVGLRLVIVTPDMHRVHHSTVVKETNSNYGNIFSLWDRVCLSYIAEPALGQKRFQIGLKQYRNPKKLGLWQILVLPFRRQV